MDLSKFFDWIKLKPRHLFGVALAAGVLLFIRDDLAAELGLLELRNNYKGWIGAAFVASSVLYVTYGLSNAGNWTLLKVRQWRNRRVDYKALGRLTEEEREILRPYIERQTKTRSLNMESGIVNELVAKGLLFRSSQVATRWPGGAYMVDHNMQPWVWEYFNKHRELLSPLHHSQEQGEV